ncbi:MAG: Transcriptional regulator PadR-like family protein [Methanocella sp. PtaU1.Bin125]|nr:MAG: Transcriptional regulator PadR-like family protein [Methanocella sp. PtaU1.Bin125]
MTAISNAEAALLGLLCERPMHGYEIEKTIEDRNMRYWTEVSFYSIYRLLRKLEARGLVQSELKLSRNNVSQKVYAITEAGRTAVVDKVKENLSCVERTISQVDVSVANLCLISNEEAVECLGRYLGSIDEAIAIYQALEKFFIENGYPETDHALALRPLAHLEAEKRWAAGFLKTLKKVT